MECFIRVMRIASKKRIFFCNASFLHAPMKHKGDFDLLLTVTSYLILKTYKLVLWNYCSIHPCPSFVTYRRHLILLFKCQSLYMLFLWQISVWCWSRNKTHRQDLKRFKWDVERNENQWTRGKLCHLFPVAIIHVLFN